MIEQLITRAKEIVLKSGLSYIGEHLEELEGVNLLGDTVEEILDMPLLLLEGFSYPESFSAIKKQEHRLRIRMFAKKFPFLFNSAPVTYPKAKFLEEVLCERIIELSDDECSSGIGFLANRYEKQDYDYYIHFLRLREELKGIIDLDVTIQIVNHFKNSYDIAEEQIALLYENARRVTYKKID